MFGLIVSPTIGCYWTTHKYLVSRSRWTCLFLTWRRYAGDSISTLEEEVSENKKIRGKW